MAVDNVAVVLMVSSPRCCGFAGDVTGGVVERGRAFRVGARLAGDATGGIIKRRRAVARRGLAGDAAGGVVESRGLCAAALDSASARASAAGGVKVNVGRNSMVVGGLIDGRRRGV